MTPYELFFAFLIGHALADYPLQGDFIGKFKSWRIASPIPGTTIWPHLLTAHALIHAGVVWLISGSAWLGLTEFVLHWLIDAAKNAGETNFHVDQLLHAACKALYVYLLLP